MPLRDEDIISENLVNLAERTGANVSNGTSYSCIFWGNSFLRLVSLNQNNISSGRDVISPQRAFAEFLEDLIDFTSDLPNDNAFLKEVCEFLDQNREEFRYNKEFLEQLYERTQKASPDNRSSVFQFFLNKNINVSPFFKEQCRLKYNLEHPALDLLHDFPAVSSSRKENNKVKRDFIIKFLNKNFHTNGIIKVRAINDFLASDQDVAAKKAFLELIPKIKANLEINGNVCNRELQVKSKEIFEKLCSPELLASQDALSEIQQLSTELDALKLGYLTRNGMGIDCFDARSFTVTINSPNSNVGVAMAGSPAAAPAQTAAATTSQGRRTTPKVG